MSPPLGALQKPVTVPANHQEQHNAEIVRTSPKDYEIRGEPSSAAPQAQPHRVGLSDSHDYGYKRLVRENDAHRKDSLRPERQAALAKSIAQGLKNLGLGIPVDVRATSKPQKQQSPRPETPPPPRREQQNVASSKQTTMAAIYRRPKEFQIHADASVSVKAKLIGVDANPVSAKDQKAGSYLNPVPGRRNAFVTETGKLALQQWDHIRSSQIAQPPQSYRGSERQPTVYSKTQNWTFDKPAQLPNGTRVFVSSDTDAKRLESWKTKETPVSPKASPTPGMSKEEARLLAQMGRIDSKLGAKSIVGNAGNQTGTINFGSGATNNSSIGGLKMGGGGGPVAAGKRSWSIDDLKQAAASAPMTSTPAAKVVVPKTGNEFQAGGTDVVPGKDHLYSADFRKSEDKSESHELTFQQFVPVTTKGGHDVKFSLVLSKDQLATKESRDSLRDRMASVVDTSLAKENMKPEEREVVVVALKMRLDEKLAETAKA